MQREPTPPIKFSYHSQMPVRESLKIPESVKSCFLRRSASQKEMERFDMQNIIIRSTFTGSKCTLCEMRYRIEEMECVNECGHSFCKKCLHDYIIYKISVMEAINCPQEDCLMQLDTDNQSFQDIPEDYKQKYRKFLLWKQTISNPNLRLCPSEHCGGVIDTAVSYTCTTCHTAFCKECMLKSHQGPCDINFQRNFKEWKRCPSCNMFIEKTEGCNHMSCLCGHQFCFVCLVDWDPQHYNCGNEGNFNQGGPFFHYLLPQAVIQMRRTTKIILGILMIIAFPIVAVVALGLVPVCAAIAGGLAAIIGPCVIAANMYCDQICCICLVIFIVSLPIAMAVSAAGVTLFVLIQGIIVYFSTIQSYLFIIRYLLCSAEEPPVQQPLVQLELEEPF